MADLLKVNAVLRTRLAAALGLEDVEGIDAKPAWAASLSPGESVVMQVLVDAHPRPVQRWAIDEALPLKDHAVPRTGDNIKTRVCRIRKRLGLETIETTANGYRASAAFVASIKGIS